MAKKLPAKGIGLSRLRVKITVCGPMTAAATPPVRTQEMARARKAGPPVSAAAKRYCCAKAPEKPTVVRPRANRAKEPKSTAQPAMRLPKMATLAPDRNPARRPTRRMSRAAGMVPSATPTLKPLTGRVASDLSASSR